MMRSDDYARIGRTLKQLNPGRWNGNTDEEVGIVHVESGAFSAEKYEAARHIASDRIGTIIDTNLPSGFFDSYFDLKTEKRRAEIASKRSSIAHEIVQQQQHEIASLRLEFEKERLPEMLAAAQFIREVEMQLQLDAVEDQRIAIQDNAKLRKEATNAGMLTADYSRLNFERGMVAVELEKIRMMNDEELRHKRNNAMLEIQASLIAVRKDHELKRRLAEADSKRKDPRRILAEDSDNREHD